MQIYEVTDPRFRKYGKVIKNIDFSSLVGAMKSTPVPEDVVYEPSIPELETLPVAEEIKRVLYGEMPIQIGYCNGHNTMLNALEYHRSSEINVAATDAILMLGLQTDVEDNYDDYAGDGSNPKVVYDTSYIKIFRLPAGMAVELYATTLHYAPCHVEPQGFQVSVILPKGTNYPLEEKHGGSEDALLAAKNKWLIGHPEGGLPEGSYLGLVGENLNVVD